MATDFSVAVRVASGKKLFFEVDDGVGLTILDIKRKLLDRADEADATGVPLDRYVLSLGGTAVADARPVSDFKLSEAVFQFAVAPAGAAAVAAAAAAGAAADAKTPKPAGAAAAAAAGAGAAAAGSAAAGAVDLSGRRVLLISNSTQHGSGYLDHCEAEMKSFLGAKVKNVLFVPYALADLDGYAAKARKRLAAMGYKCTSVHEAKDNAAAQHAVAVTDAVFIGGGNTFRLLKRMYDGGILDAIRARVLDGMPYVGTSAGSNVATPSIRTTNDMPIVYPPSFAALNVFPYQLNAHFIAADPHSTHMGETREDRLREFHEENATPVIGLPEGGMILLDRGTITLKVKDAKVFVRSKPIQTWKAGTTSATVSFE